MAQETASLNKHEVELKAKTQRFVQLACSEYYTAALPDKSVRDPSNAPWKVYYSYDMVAADVEEHFGNAARLQFQMTPYVQQAVMTQTTTLKWLYFRTRVADYFTLLDFSYGDPQAFVKPIPRKLCAYMKRLAVEQFVYIDARAMFGAATDATIYTFPPAS